MVHKALMLGTFDLVALKSVAIHGRSTRHQLVNELKVLRGKGNQARVDQSGAAISNLEGARPIRS